MIQYLGVVSFHLFHTLNSFKLEPPKNSRTMELAGIGPKTHFLTAIPIVVSSDYDKG
jgi:hypothetical protein